jgi:3-hydroxyisobutyrate dehydrogenase
MKIGIIGLGMMGSAVASRLLKKGYAISVFNRDGSKATPLSKLGATVADNPYKLANNSDLMISCLTDYNAIRQVILGKNGFAKSRFANNLVLVNLSTISPEQSRTCAGILNQEGIEMLEMPVMGGPAAAEAGELVTIVAGSEKTFKKVRPVLKKLGDPIFYVGEKIGTASTIKLAMNLNIALIAAALAEGITLTKAAGIDPELFLNVLNSTYFKTGLSEKKGPKMLKGDFQPSFHLRNMVKDLELAASTALSEGISLPQTVLAQQIYRAANNSGYSELDYTSIVDFLSKVNGLDRPQVK